MSNEPQVHRGCRICTSVPHGAPPESADLQKKYYVRPPEAGHFRKHPDGDLVGYIWKDGTVHELTREDGSSGGLMESIEEAIAAVDLYWSARPGEEPDANGEAADVPDQT